MEDLLRATARAETHHFWFRGFRWFVQPLIRRAVDGATDLHVLDCGCGTGANLALFAPLRAVYGLDTTELGLLTGRQAGRHGLVRASATQIPFEHQSFHILTSFDLLYALDDRDERAAVAEMFRVLKPGGRLIVNVAAMDVLRGDHSILSRERRRYTRASLASLLTSAGFEIERITHTNAAIFLPMLAGRAWQRARGLAPEAEATAEITVPPAPVNAALTALLFLESLWLRAGGTSAFGSSLLCLARRPAAARPR